MGRWLWYTSVWRILLLFWLCVVCSFFIPSNDWFQFKYNCFNHVCFFFHRNKFIRMHQLVDRNFKSKWYKCNTKFKFSNTNLHVIKSFICITHSIGYWIFKWKKTLTLMMIPLIWWTILMLLWLLCIAYAFKNAVLGTIHRTKPYFFRNDPAYGITGLFQYLVRKWYGAAE